MSENPGGGPDPDEQRGQLRRMWDRAAGGWGRRAERIREWGMPVSVRMIECVAPQAGERVLELAAGPGDTGFLAAELIQPGGTLISSDGSETMLGVARERAGELGIENVEFRQLELEWIDLPTADVDVVLCRWGVMLIVDPAAALQEIRRVLRPGGRLALAVWAEPARNPWATISTDALIAHGLAERPPRDAPGMFALADPGRLTAMLEAAGFGDIRVEAVPIERLYADADQYIDETLEVSPTFASLLSGAGEDVQAQVRADIATRLERFRDDGEIRLPGRSLLASAGA